MVQLKSFERVITQTIKLLGDKLQNKVLKDEEKLFLRAWIAAGTIYASIGSGRRSLAGIVFSYGFSFF